MCSLLERSKPKFSKQKSSLERLHFIIYKCPCCMKHKITKDNNDYEDKNKQKASF